MQLHTREENLWNVPDCTNMSSGIAKFLELWASKFIKASLEMKKAMKDYGRVAIPLKFEKGAEYNGLQMVGVMEIWKEAPNALMWRMKKHKGEMQTPN